MYIYSLADPDGTVRYIGKADNPQARYYIHIWEAKNKVKKSSHKSNWINKLLSQNERPLLEIVEETNLDSWKFDEKFWIQQFRAWGFDLTNTGAGGESGFVCEKMRQASRNAKGKGRPKGLKQTEEAKLKIKQKRALQVMTKESNRKRGEKLKGRTLSPETRLKISQNTKGKKKHKKGIKKEEI